MLSAAERQAGRRGGQPAEVLSICLLFLLFFFPKDSRRNVILLFVSVQRKLASGRSLHDRAPPSSGEDSLAGICSGGDLSRLNAIECLLVMNGLHSVPSPDACSEKAVSYVRSDQESLRKTDQKGKDGILTARGTELRFGGVPGDL